MTTLKNILLINAVSSGATGIGTIIFSEVLASLFSISHQGALQEVGLFLIIFALIVAYQAFKNPISVKGVQFIIILDSLWVITSLILILFQLFSLSFMGYLIVGVIAAWVAAMAVLQTIGLKQQTA